MESAANQKLLFSMSIDNVPEEALPRESFAFLASTYHDLKIKVNEPLAEAPDRTSAAAAVLGRQALILAMRYLWRTLTFLLTDRRFHPDADVKIDAHSILKYEARLQLDFQKLAAMSVNARPLLPSVPSAIADELRILHLSSDVFFELLETVFPLREIAKCRMSFSLVMQAIGTPTAVGALANYERRHKTMYRAIANWQANGGTTKDTAAEAVKEMEKRLAELRSSVDANTRAVANMDRRQKKFFTFLAPVQQKLAAIFHRKEKDPYAAVTVPEPRRSQLIAVIDYTMTHPIVHDGKSRDEFTLSNAARAVWNMNHRKWELVKGGYETFEALKSACYGLQKKQNDPFRYH